MEFFVFSLFSLLCQSSQDIIFVYSESTIRIPASISRRTSWGRFLTFWVRNDLSTVINWETLATDFFGSPEILLDRRTFPGAAANLKFDVMTTAITVRILLRLKSSDCTIRNGRLYPGSEAEGFGSEAHHISPLFITTHPLQWKSTALSRELSRALKFLSHKACSVFLWSCHSGTREGICWWLLCTTRFLSFRDVLRAFRRPNKWNRVSK